MLYSFSFIFKISSSLSRFFTTPRKASISFTPIIPAYFFCLCTLASEKRLGLIQVFLSNIPVNTSISFLIFPNGHSFRSKVLFFSTTFRITVAFFRFLLTGAKTGSSAHSLFSGLLVSLPLSLVSSPDFSGKELNRAVRGTSKLSSDFYLISLSSKNSKKFGLV